MKVKWLYYYFIMTAQFGWTFIATGACYLELIHVQSFSRCHKLISLGNGTGVTLVRFKTGPLSWIPHTIYQRNSTQYLCCSVRYHGLWWADVCL